MCVYVPVCVFVCVCVCSVNMVCSIDGDKTGELELQTSEDASITQSVRHKDRLKVSQ